MSLKKQIEEKLNKALKEKDKNIYPTLRLVVSSIKDAEIANRTKEIDVINQFLPKQLSDEETKKICEETVKSVGAASMKDMGKVMGALKSKYSDTLDFSKVSPLIKELLK